MNRRRVALLLWLALLVIALLRGDRYVDRGTFRIDMLRLLFTVPLGLLVAGAVLHTGHRWGRSRAGAAVLWSLAMVGLGTGLLLAIVPLSATLTWGMLLALILWGAAIGTPLGLVLASDDTAAGEKDSASPSPHER